MQTAIVIGGSGQVGWELRRSLSAMYKVISLDYPGINIADFDETIAKIKSMDFDVIINAAAYNAVDKAEVEPDMALAINGEFPYQMAKWCAANSKLFISYSTDFVFDGTKAEPYLEDDPCAPLGAYARSKVRAEQGVIDAGAGIMLRVSWVYSSRAANFLLKILELVKSREEISVVDDQIGSPTPARYIAEATVTILGKLKYLSFAEQCKFSGIYNLASSGYVSRYDFAVKFYEQLKVSQRLQCKKILAVKTKAFVTPAQRPLSSKLSTQKIAEVFSIYSQPWEDGLDLIMEELNLR